MPLADRRIAIAIGGLAVAGLLGAAQLEAQVTLAEASRDLASPDAAVRLRTVRMLRDAGTSEAALPVAALVADPDRGVRLEAIAAELDFFLDERIEGRRRSPEPAFEEGLFAVGTRIVPVEVLTALRTAARDLDPVVAVAGMYAFGTLGTQSAGAVRADLLRDAAPDLSALLGASDPELRLAALRVVGRLYAHRPWQKTIDETLGDAVIQALNDRSERQRAAAMQALGAMRYVRAVEALAELHTYYQRGQLAEASLDALARIAAPASTPLFQAAIAGRSVPLKQSGVEGLARLGDRARDAEVRAAVRNERGQPMVLAGSYAELLLGGGSLDAVVGALMRDGLREQALGYLLEIAPGRAGLFGRYTQDPDPRVRIGVADALGWSGDLTAVPIVEAMRRDLDPAVVRAAERALVRLRADTR
jgi:HEAT repeat protein